MNQDLNALESQSQYVLRPHTDRRDALTDRKKEIDKELEGEKRASVIAEKMKERAEIEREITSLNRVIKQFHDRASAVSLKIQRAGDPDVMETPEARLFFAIFDRGLHDDDKRYLIGSLPQLEQIGINPDYAKKAMRQAGFIPPL